MATATPSRPLEVRAQLRYGRFSPYKAREVLDLIRGKSVAEARSILQFTERACSVPIMKVLDSAVANAGNNNDIPPDELFVSACFADEGPTLRRFRPRARGRGARIRKRTCHVTIVLGRLSANELERARMRDAGRRVAPADARAARARRVARSRGAAETVDAVEAEETTEEVVENTFAEDAIDSGQAEAPEIEIVEDGITPDTAEEDAEAHAPSDEADVETEAEGGGDAEEPAAESDETDAESNEKDA
jgi:large subunit ribosomal protein L22